MRVQLQVDGEQPRWINEGQHLIGRGEDCDVLLPEDDAGASRRHALLEGDDAGNWSITDLKSRNGTYVNANRIDRRQRLQNGDVITMGQTRIAMTIPRSQPTIQGPASVNASINMPSPAAPPNLPTIVPSEYSVSALPSQALIPASDTPAPSFSASNLTHPVEQVPQPAPANGPLPVAPVTPENKSAPPVQPASVMERSEPSPVSPIIQPLEVKMPVQEFSLPPAEPAPCPAPDRPPLAAAAGVPGSLEAQRPLFAETQNPPLDMDAGVLLESLIQNVQCAHCGMRYADSLRRCPVCGRAPEPAGGTAQPPSSPVGTSEPARSVPTGAFDPVSNPAQSPSYAGQMFPPQTGSPSQSAELSTTPLVITPSHPPTAYSGDAVRSGTAPLIVPGGANDLPILPIASAVASLLMLASLFMPWAEVQIWFASMGGSYVQLCELALRAMNGSPAAVNADPRALFIFLPGVATLVTVASIGARKTSRVQAALLLTGGVLGLLSGGMVYYYLSGGALNFSGILGLGFKLFTFTSIAAAGIGLWKLISSMIKP